jgi:hypothetical protein
MMPQMTLAEAAGFLRPQVAPGNWQILLLLFLALLRKLGFLPEKDDDEYTQLGVTSGFALAAQDAHNKINGFPGDPNAKQMMHQTVDYWRVKFQTGNVSLV